MDFNFSKIVFPTENLSKVRFDDECLDEFIPLETISESIQQVEELVPHYVEHSDLFPHLAQGSHLLTWASEWQQRIVKRIPSWHCRFTVAAMFDAYRRMAPQAEFQTRDHQRMLGAVATAADLLTSVTLAVDDVFDGSATRNGVQAYHLARPLSYGNDLLLVSHVALRMLKVFIPDHYPCKNEMIETAETFVSLSAMYFSYHSRVAEGIRSAAGSKVGNPEHIPVGHYSVQEYRAMNFLRVWQYTQFMMDMCRYATCYLSVPQDSFHSVINELTLVLCLIEDSVDSARWEICQDIRIGEISAPLAILGEIVNVGYPAEILGDRFRDMVPDAERADIAKAMRRHLVTGSDEDSETIWLLYERFELRSMVQQRLRYQLAVVVPDVCGQEEQRIHSGFLRRTLLETCLVWMVDNNPEATATDREFLDKIRTEWKSEPEMVPKILLDAFTKTYTKN